MDSTIVLEQYPYWFIAFCLLLGLLYALFLYFKDSTFKEASKRERLWLFPLSLLRFLVVSTIAFLLLSPLMKTRFTDIVKPFVIFAQDNSESIKRGFANEADTASYANQVQQLVDQLGEKYNVKTYNFGEDLEEGLNFSFDEKVTNLSKSLEELYSNFENQNVGAIILATDGVFNQGSNPMYANTKLDVPLFGIAMGDTTAQRDLIVEKVLHNKIAYLGDKFTIRVDISAKNCAGETTVLNVYKGKGTSNKVYSKTIRIKTNDFIFSEDVILNADSPGIQQYSIRTNGLKGEVSTQNNQQDIYVDILDNRQKILILAASPHPDITALKQSIENNKNYETTIAFAGSFNQSVKDFNLAILHGLPSASKGISTILDQLKTQRIPMWFILSTQTSVSAFNQAQKVMQISGGGGSSTNEAKALVQNDFNLFTFDAALNLALPSLPPLQVPFGEYSAAPTTQTLLKQKIGSVSTKYPLLNMEQATGYKVAVLAGEGLWRWRLYDYKTNQNHAIVNELVSKVVQYLAVKNDKRKFRVNMPKNLFNESERITFDAELYNDSYEMINNSEANLTIYDDAGKAFPFVFNKTGSGYFLDAGFFPAGNYSYKAKTAFNGKEYTAKGNFSVAAIKLESLVTTANHQLIHNLSNRYGGEVVYPDSIASLQRILGAKENIKSVQYSSYQTKDLINYKWLFWLFFGFLTIEWFVRKFIGGY